MKNGLKIYIKRSKRNFKFFFNIGFPDGEFIFSKEYNSEVLQERRVYCMQLFIG